MLPVEQPDAPPSSPAESPFPESLSGATRVGPHQVGGDEILFAVPGIARFHVTASAARADPSLDTSPADLAWLLDEHLVSVQRLLAGAFTLWAAAVCVNGHAVALVGEETAGKSSLAAGLALRGHPLLADAALPVAVGGAQPIAQSTTDRVSLWPRALRELGLEPDHGEPGRPGSPRRACRFARAGAAPLSTIVSVIRSDLTDAGPVLDHLGGGRAIEAVLAATAMPALVDTLGLTAARFRWAAGLTRKVRVLQLRSSRFRNELPAAITLLAGELGA